MTFCWDAPMTLSASLCVFSWRDCYERLCTRSHWEPAVASTPDILSLIDLATKEYFSFVFYISIWSSRNASTRYFINSIFHGSFFACFQFGRGTKRELKSATATTAEMFGRLNLRIVHGGAATLHSIKVLQPKQVGSLVVLRCFECDLRRF